MGLGSRKAQTSDLKQLYAILRRVDDRARQSVAAVSVLSMLSGLAEAGMLVLVTSVAVSVTEPSGESLAAGPVSLTRTTALVAATGLLLAYTALVAAVAHVTSATCARASLAARQQLIDAFHRASYQMKSRDRIASLQEALTTWVDRFASSFVALTNFVSASLTLSSFAIAAFVVDLGASIALALLGLLMLAVLRPAAKRTRSSSLRLRQQREEYAQTATESVLLSRELAVFGVAERAGENLRAVDANVAFHFQRTRFLAALTPRVYQSLALLLVIISLAAVTSSDTTDIAAVGAVALLLVRSLSYGQQMLTALQQQAELRPNAEALLALIDRYESEPRHRGRARIDTIGRIELRDVDFAYDPGGADALRDIDLEVAPGEAVGVIGPSGSGKSTLVNLLLRLYEPTAGSITVGGIPLREVHDADWHGLTAIVPQDPRLIHGTVAENIRFYRDLSDEEVVAAARDANILEFIESRPGGFDAVVGDLGHGMSGGQRQRLCIARALAGSPRLLVLDEPTSALDADSEAAIQRTLESLRGRITLVIVAHRLSTLAACDRLVVIESGRLSAAGTPAELRNVSHYYQSTLDTLRA